MTATEAADFDVAACENEAVMGNWEKRVAFCSPSSVQTHDGAPTNAASGSRAPIGTDSHGSGRR